MRELDLGGEVTPRAKLMAKDKATLVSRIEKDQVKLHKQTHMISNLNAEVAHLRGRNAALFHELGRAEEDCRRADDKASDHASTLTTIASAMEDFLFDMCMDEQADQVRVAMAFARVLERTIRNRFDGSIHKAAFATGPTLQYSVREICKTACYIPRPGSPLSTRSPAT